MNTRINFELANLLEEKGYPFEFFSIGEVKDVPSNIPTISKVIMWLYEKHGIWVNVYYNSNHKVFDYTFDNINWTKEEADKNYLLRIDELVSGLFKTRDKFNSPTEAYKAAIEYCLKNFI
jgi:hypothetical protein